MGERGPGAASTSGRILPEVYSRPFAYKSQEMDHQRPAGAAGRGTSKHCKTSLLLIPSRTSKPIQRAPKMAPTRRQLKNPLLKNRAALIATTLALLASAYAIGDSVNSNSVALSSDATSETQMKPKGGSANNIRIGRSAMQASELKLDDVEPAHRNALDGSSVASLQRHHPSSESLPQAGLSNQHQSLRIERLFAPDLVQNSTQNVTLDCMFSFDRKLDRRLAIKWFFEDQPEPIYQWIPELNKRVYSDHFERYLDKSYQVSEDVDFMLSAYRRLLSSQPSPELVTLLPQSGTTNSLASGSGEANFDDADSSDQTTTTTTTTSIELADEPPDQAAGRRLLADRLLRLSRLGGRQSRKLLEQLRRALQMGQPDYSRYRALRLVRPSNKLAGRYTCSVSSLEGDDLRSTRLQVYEPPRAFSFNVVRTSERQFNLTCQAEGLFPRPRLTLYRFRAAKLEQQSINEMQPAGAATQPAAASGRPVQIAATRPRLAATLLRQEPILDAQSELRVAPAGSGSGSAPAFDYDTQTSGSGPAESALAPEALAADLGYQATAWATIDEASLSSNAVTQFECLLQLDGLASFERRQALALQRGWHVNSAALLSRSSLVGLLSALASTLCLLLALGSSVLIVRLVRRHAAKSRLAKVAVTATGSSSQAANPNANPNGFGGNQVRKHSVNQLKLAAALDSPLSSDGATTTSSTLAGSRDAPKQQVEQPDEAIYRIPVGRSCAFGAIRRITDQQQQQHYQQFQQQQQALQQQQGFQGSDFLAQQRTVGTILNYDHQAPRPTTFGGPAKSNRPIDC